MSGYHERDITGQRFGSLTAIRRADNKGKNLKWLFRCDCGIEVAMFKGNVVLGNIKQCTDCGRKVQGEKITKHSRSHDPIYQIFHAAKNRCLCPTNPRYAQYGGRGIKFLFSSFQEFSEAMGPRPKGTSLNRIDNDGPYSVKNCEWATWKEQFRTRRPWNWRTKSQPRPTQSQTA